jgi:APA family basic amino acid/polyamine antiporter
MQIFSTKPLGVLLAQAGEEGRTTLLRTLGPLQLTALGIGAIVGAGIFVITGQAAAQYAGPAIALSFVVAAAVCALAALCYAELSAMIPVAGSAYTYAYASLGELVAWIVAWDLVAEYVFAAAAVAVGWSGYFVGLLEQFGVPFPAAFSQAPLTVGNGGELIATGAVLNIPAIAIVLAITGVLLLGAAGSSVVNTVIVAVKVSVILAVIVCGAAYVTPQHWQPFIPPAELNAMGDPVRFGVSGIFAATGVVFFAYLGFDTVSTAAQEARHPQRTMPIAILASLGIATVLYLGVCLVLTGMAPYRLLDVPAPVYTAVDLAAPQLGWLKFLISAGVAVGLASTLLALLYAQSRNFYAMSRDGLLPEVFARVHERRRTPRASTVITATSVALLAGVLPVSVLGELVSVGTLMAFAIIAAGVMYLRLRRPEIERPFRAPLWWLTAPACIASCLFLILHLQRATLMRLFVWMALGLVLYFAYGYWHSKLRTVAAARTAGANISSLP